MLLKFMGKTSEVVQSPPERFSYSNSVENVRENAKEILDNKH